MTKFIQDDRVFRPTNGFSSADIHDTLPVGTYTIGEDRSGLFLIKGENLTVPTKIYGDSSKKAERIITTFLARSGSTGVLLEGEKGSGKTLLTKLISVRAYERNIPTIIVNADRTGDDFNNLLQQVVNPCIVLFDEFEKTYARTDKQDQILTLMDGTVVGQKLFLLTANDHHQINHHLRNRPGRIFYNIKYASLSPQFIGEYCTDVLNKKEYTNEVIRIAEFFSEFNFDMLQAIVEEVNRYDEPPLTVIDMLNVHPANEGDERYDVELYVNNTLIEPSRLHNRHFRGAPMDPREIIDIYYETAVKTLTDSDSPTISLDSIDESGHAVFSTADLVAINSAIGQLSFKNQQGETLILKKATKPQMLALRNILA